MLYVSYYGRIPLLQQLGFAPNELVTIARRPPYYKLPADIVENRFFAPREPLYQAYKMGGIDEYSFRVLYYDYLTFNCPPDRLRRIIDFRGYRVFLTYKKDTWREVLAKWLSDHGIPCEEWVPTIDVEGLVPVL